MKGGFPIGEGAVHDDLGQGFQGGAHAGYAISNGVVVLGQGFHGGVHVGRGGAKPDALFRFPKSEGPFCLERVKRGNNFIYYNFSLHLCTAILFQPEWAWK